MKYVLLFFTLGFTFTSYSLPKDTYKKDFFFKDDPVKTDNYIILKNGQKLDNITKDQWKELRKKSHLTYNNMVIEADSIEWLHTYHSGFLLDGLNYNDPNGFLTLSESGKISVYYKMVPTAKHDGYQPLYYLAKENGAPFTTMDPTALFDLMRDNQKCLDMLEDLGKKWLKRRNPEEWIKIIKTFNGN